LPNIALVDTGFWIAVFDQGDQHHPSAVRKVDEFSRLHYILPWPVMYETLRTRLVRQPSQVKKFESFVKNPRAIWLDDRHYRDQALDLAFSVNGRRAISLVDHVLRLIIEDIRLRVRYFYTFNPNDFRDVCIKRKVEIS
jgi:predicted nucleic acid-binding protein